jgi:hypothetical protein
LHVETGYVRVPSPKKVEMVISQPTGTHSSPISCFLWLILLTEKHMIGVVSVEEGTVDGTVIQVETISLARTSSAKVYRLAIPITYT